MDDLSVFADYQEAPYPGVRVRDVPAEMLLEIAKGMEEPELVAARFEFTPMEFQALQAWPPFQAQVEQKRAELQASGVTFRIKMAYMAEDLAHDIYRMAKQDTTTLPQKIETFRTMAKLADLEPKQSAATTPTGPAFSININLPSVPTKTITVDNGA